MDRSAQLQAHAKLQHGANKWTARIIPLILIGIVGYVTWAVIALLCVNYLLHPPRDVPSRHGAGIAVIVIHFLILLPMTVSYFRVLQIVATNPGYVNLGKNEWSKGEKDEPFSPPASGMNKEFLDRRGIIENRVPPPQGLQHFLDKDVFECDIDGYPRWCSSCRQWKPDRSHHSSELGRCVHKMDHFCPWAGGIVSETNFKFFIQFLFYTAMYCVLVLVVSAYFLHTRLREVGSYQVNWIISIVLAGLFLLFSGGMLGNSLDFALMNTTTVDNLTRASRVHQFAVLVPNSAAGMTSGLSLTNGHQPPGQVSRAETPNLSQNPPPYGVVTFPSVRRTYAILQTPAGRNPYKLESHSENFKTVMGDHFLDWFFPVKLSPCCNHHQLNDGGESGSSGTSMYKLGPVVDEMRAQAGLTGPPVHASSHGGRRKRRRHRRSAASEGRPQSLSDTPHIRGDRSKQHGGRRQR